MSMTNEQIAFVNDLAERLESAESANEQYGELGDKLDSVNELAKNFDFGSEIAEIKQVLGQVVGFLGMDLGGEEVGAVTAEGGMEKGDSVVARGEETDARRKDGKNFAADHMPIPGNSGATEVASGGETAPGKKMDPKSLSKSGTPTLMDVVVTLSKRVDELAGQGSGRTAVQPTGEPVAKRGGERGLFVGKF